MFDLSSRRLYLCTDLREGLIDFVADVIAGGVDIVQLRAKLASAADIVHAARELRALCADLSVPFIVNDRPDLALDVGADGVHVGQDDASVTLCRRILGETAIVGLSTHDEADLERAGTTNATYLSAGPVTATPTKPGRAGTGIDYVGLASARDVRPVFVTGGVTPDSVPDLVAAGVRHFVVVRYLTTARHPREAAQRLREAIDTSVAT